MSEGTGGWALPSRRSRLGAALALGVALAPWAVREVAPTAAARGHYAAVGHRLGSDHPLRPLVEAFGPRSWEDPWGNRPWWSEAGDLVVSGPDGRWGTADDVVLQGWVQRTWRTAPDGSFEGAPWWLLHVVPCLAAPLAAWLLGRGLGRGHPARGRVRALATLLSAVMFVWLAGEGARDAAEKLARDHLLFALPTLASPHLVAWGSATVGVWVPLLCLDLALHRVSDDRAVAPSAVEEPPRALLREAA